MNNLEDKKGLLEAVLGAEITIHASDLNPVYQADLVQVVSTDLYQSLTRFFGETPPLFTVSMPLDRIVRYKDGSYSSMERALVGGIAQHQGYDLVNGLNLAQHIMDGLMPVLSHRLIAIYSDLIAQNSAFASQINNIFIVPELSKLKSTSEFIKEVAQDIRLISRSDRLGVATLSNVQQRRIDLNQTFYTFTSRLSQSANGGYFDAQSVADDYFVARHALSNYIVALVLEIIIARTLDDESVTVMRRKVVECFERLNAVTEDLARSLQNRELANWNEINNIDNFYRWSYDFMASNRRNSLHAQNQQIRGLKENALSYFDIQFELDRVDEFVRSRHNLVRSVVLRRGDEDGPGISNE